MEKMSQGEREAMEASLAALAGVATMSEKHDGGVGRHIQLTFSSGHDVGHSQYIISDAKSGEELFSTFSALELSKMLSIGIYRVERIFVE